MDNQLVIFEEFKKGFFNFMRHCRGHFFKKSCSIILSSYLDLTPNHLIVFGINSASAPLFFNLTRIV